MYRETDTDWMNYSECLGSEDPEMFFPERYTRLGTEAAKKVCSRCVVVAECLSYALKNNEEFGIWGGLTEKERQDLKRRNGRSNRIYG